MAAMNGYAFAAPGAPGTGHPGFNGETLSNLGNPGTGHPGSPGQGFSLQDPGTGPSEVPSELVFETLGGAELAAYRMRAYDSTLGRLVYWNSKSIDLDAGDYNGPGPLSDIVLQLQLGANPKFP